MRQIPAAPSGIRPLGFEFGQSQQAWVALSQSVVTLKIANGARAPVGASLEISQAHLGEGERGWRRLGVDEVAELRLPHVPVTSWATSEDAEERALSQCHAVTQGGLQQGRGHPQGGSPWRSQPHRVRQWPSVTSDPCTRPPHLWVCLSST